MKTSIISFVFSEMFLVNLPLKEFDSGEKVIHGTGEYAMFQVFGLLFKSKSELLNYIYDLEDPDAHKNYSVAGFEKYRVLRACGTGGSK